ncbi:hypothetical protein [Peredibacter starrii]|uniref:Uncharacterized protein n=1 Tax=Peredibacter starrii TaxID=28202 RepID=A0AAX4HJW8_9BACT|nr:hypothetical protein [Peredibacter starrii]WPU63522.1 hypothetical protein SOO65_12570 [Peredibacter starrii]
MARLTTSTGSRGESATARNKSGNHQGNRSGAVSGTGVRSSRTPKHK